MISLVLQMRRDSAIATEELMMLVQLLLFAKAVLVVASLQAVGMACLAGSGCFRVAMGTAPAAQGPSMGMRDCLAGRCPGKAKSNGGLEGSRRA